MSNGSLTERLAILIESVASTLVPAARTAGGTSQTALAVLAALGADVPISLGAVAAHAGIAKSTASELVGELERRGLVRRERDARDARRVALRITTGGRRELAATRSRDLSPLAAAVAALPPAEAAALERTLHELAEALAVPARPKTQFEIVAPTHAAGNLRLLSISLCGGEYALPLDRICEVLPFTASRSVASPLPWLSGVIAVRDGLLPVCDLRLRLSIAGPTPETPESYVVVDGPEGRAALTVDRVNGLTAVVAGDVAPPVGGGIGVAGIAAIGDRLLVLLDIDRLLSS